MLFPSEDRLMRLPKPTFQHPPEVYGAIIREHGGDPVQIAYRLQSFGWPLADAAWAAVHWDLTWLAAAIANERQARRSFHPEGSASAPPPSKRTNRLPKAVPLFRTPRFTAGSAKPPARGKEPSETMG